METLVPLAIAAMVAIFIMVAIFGYLQEKRRAEALRLFAEARGLRFDTTRDHSMMDRLPHLRCLRQGEKGRMAFNHIRGPWRERSLHFFDYRYQTTSRNNKGHTSTHNHYFSAVLIATELPLHELHIRPEGMLDRMGAFLGIDDIDFESAEFSRRFHVKAPDRKWAYDVLHARAMERLLKTPDYTLQMQGIHVIAWQARRFDPQQIEEAADLICDLLDALPRYVQQALRQS